MSRLRAKVREIRRRNAARHWYIPEALFLQVATDELIHQALGETPSYQREETVTRISQHGKKIFGILVLLDLAARVSKFIEASELRDERLPFKLAVLLQDVGLSEDEANDFHERQWELTAPVFFHGTLHTNMTDYTVMPFEKDEELGQGSFGLVYKVSLDPDHQGAGSLFPKVFARKEFKVDRNPKANRSSDSHQRELRNLAILSRLKHPNIVALLGSYTYNGRHNLLFEMATDGNLAALISTTRPSQFESDHAIVIALARLASAIEHVHNYTETNIDLSLIGCHHDLRPRNILVSGPHFILADFGLSTFKEPSQNSATPFKPTTDDYLAPECEDLDSMFSPGTVHRSSDIWSFGCIIAEVATYMDMGNNGVKKFRRARVYQVRGFELCLFHQGSSSSTAVEEWLTNLISSTSSHACFVAALTARMLLQMDQSKRPSAKQVTLTLRRAALFSIASTVQSLFDQAREIRDSMDLYLQEVKFASWRYALAIIDAPDTINPCHKTTADMSAFETVLKVLLNLLQDLESRTLQSDAQQITFSKLFKVNDDLRGLLNREQTARFYDYFRITVVQRDDELLHQSGITTTDVLLDDEIRIRATIRHVNRLLEQGCISDSRGLMVDLSNVHIGDRCGRHRMAELMSVDQQPRRIWVEWRGYLTHGADEEIQEKLYGRTAKLAELLSQEKPASFRVLDCCGFFHDPSRAAFGLMFDIPKGIPQPYQSNPISLLDIIEATADRRSLWPDLDDKLDLAKSLATTVFELHTVGWFHKAIMSSNILFFSNEDSRHEIHDPFLVGFNHSRSDEHLTFTTGITESTSKDYQHPVYIKEGFGYRHEFDYYSLGIVLMEIGLWQPLDRLINSSKYSNLSYEQRRQRLLTDRVPLLRQHMGREYYEAVRWCIQGSTVTGSTVASRGKADVLAFLEQVVSRLRAPFKFTSNSA